MDTETLEEEFSDIKIDKANKTTHSGKSPGPVDFSIL